MKTKLLIIAGLALAISAPFARAQEDWGEGDRRGEYMRELRMDCENGDERACERLRHMRHEWREDRRWREDERDRGGNPSSRRSQARDLLGNPDQLQHLRHTKAGELRRLGG